jgi:hypothetical protein
MYQEHWTGKPLALLNKASAEPLLTTATYLGITSQAEMLKLPCLLSMVPLVGTIHASRYEDPVLRVVHASQGLIEP